MKVITNNSKFVDAGHIAIVNVNKIKKYKPNLKPKNRNVFEIINIKDGVYNIMIGDNYYELELKEGKYYFGDLCYAFNSNNYDSWDKLLKDTDYLTNCNYELVKKLDDGFYSVEIIKKWRLK